MTQAMTNHVSGRQRTPAGAVSISVQRRPRRRMFPRGETKVSPLVQQDQDRQDDMTEFIAEPTAASPPEPFAREDYFCQDKLY